MGYCVIRSVDLAAMDGRKKRLRKTHEGQATYTAPQLARVAFIGRLRQSSLGGYVCPRFKIEVTVASSLLELVEEKIDHTDLHNGGNSALADIG